MDLSKASKNTRQIYRALGMTPLGNAANLSIVTGIDEHKVANVLRRGELGIRGRRKDAQMKGDDGEVELLFSVKMGRVRKATRRYAYTYAGLLECNRVLGVQAQWFHSGSGLATLAGQLQLAEVCYEVMPHLWQLNTVGDPTVQVIGRRATWCAWTGPSAE